MKNKALILNCNNIMSLPIIRSLGKKGVFISAVFGQSKHQSNYYNLVSKSKYIKERILFDEDDYEHNLILTLIDFGKNQKSKPVIFLASDTDLQIISKNRNRISDYYHFSLPPNEMIENLLRKENFINLACKHGFDIPHSVKVSNINNIESLTQSFRFPFIIKPSWRSNEWLRKFGEKKLFQINTLSDLNSFRIAVNNFNTEYLIQELIPGNEDNIFCTFCVANRDSEILQIGCCRKLRQYPKNFGNTSIARTCISQQLEDLTNAIVKKLKLVGYINIEFKFDPSDKKYKIIEITPNRFNRQFLITDIMELNLPYTLYQMELDIVNKYKKLRYIRGAWLSEVNEIRTVKDYKEEYNLFKYIRTLLNVRRMEIFSIKDPKPFIQLIFTGIKNLTIKQ